MEWVVGIQVDADARIYYVHMDDLKRCAPPDPTPSWPEVARGTSIVLSTRAPSTAAQTITDSPIQDLTDRQCQYRIKVHRVTIVAIARCAHPL